jgi:hypothetical protein
MQHAEDSNQTNEGNNEEGRKKTSTCWHTTLEQICALGNFENGLKNDLPLLNCALGNFEKGLKNDLPLVIRASKLAKYK